MHPLVYYAIVEFDRNEMLRDVEQERRRRELQADQRLERTGRRVGHGHVAPVRPSVLARALAVLRGRPAAPVRPAAPARALGAAVGRAGHAPRTIGCSA